MSKRLTTEQLEAIRKRVEEAREYGHGVGVIVFGDVPALLAEVERLQTELAGDGLLTLPDQVDHAREEIARIRGKFEDMTSIALWSARRLRHEQHKDFAYDAIEANLGEGVERV